MGTPHVVNGAVLQCSFGSAPSTLTVLPINRMFSSHQPAATIMDHRPMVNIQPFAMCACPANPQVAAATAAAWGTLTPQPCAPHDQHALGARLPHSIACQPADAQSDVDVRVPVGRRRQCPFSGTRVRNHSLTPACLWVNSDGQAALCRRSLGANHCA